MRSVALASLGLASVAGARLAAADPTSGVDAALFRSAYDANGLFAIEGARLLPTHDLSFKLLGGYGHAPLAAAIPGIGDAGADRILDYVATVEMAFGMTLANRFAIGFDVAGYRTRPGTGYGARGLYRTGGGTTPSTGVVALRPLSNIDPSANPGSAGYLGDELAGPLDARAGIKVGLYASQAIAITAIGSVFLPFGDDDMLLGDRGLVFEPKLAVDWHHDRITATRVIANVAARLRERTVLQSYDPAVESMDDAKAYLDVASEIVAGVGAAFELTPRVVAALEAQVFVPLGAVAYGRCRVHDGRACSALTDADYAPTATRGDLTSLVTLGAMVRVTPDVTADLMLGTGVGGVRGDDLRISTGIVWSPQPAGVAAPGRRDLDGDGLPDSVDACTDEPEDKDGFEDEDGCPDPDNDQDGIPDAGDRCPNEAEDKDGFQDADGCPERDNDDDGIPDAADRCAEQAEDKDGFEDDDGCPELDNDGDGFADGADKCPNDAETVNGVDDDDGCPDVRGTTGPEERVDRIDLKGAPISFTRRTAALTAPAKQVLEQVAGLVRNRKLTLRIEVHVALGTPAKAAGAIAAQKRQDKILAQQRAQAVRDFLFGKGVPATQLQAVGLGADRPLGGVAPTDAAQDRVELIKAQQGSAP